MAYTLEEVAQREGWMMLVVALILVACIFWVIIQPNIIPVLIIVAILAAALLAKADFAEWEDFINEYSE
jgi:hypothetical protein